MTEPVRAKRRSQQLIMCHLSRPARLAKASICAALPQGLWPLRTASQNPDEPEELGNSDFWGQPSAVTAVLCFPGPRWEGRSFPAETDVPRED